MSVSAQYSLQLRANELVDLALDLVATNPTILHEITGSNGTLNATSTVPATKAWSDTRALVAGVDALDLTALVRDNLPNVDFTGLKVQLIKIKAAAANTAAIKFDVGSVNGYNVFGSATSELSLDAGQEVIFLGNDKLPDVAAGAKAIDLTSSDVDAQYSVILVAG